MLAHLVMMTNDWEEREVRDTVSDQQCEHGQAELHSTEVPLSEDDAVRLEEREDQGVAEPTEKREEEHDGLKEKH